MRRLMFLALFALTPSLAASQADDRPTVAVRAPTGKRMFQTASRQHIHGFHGEFGTTERTLSDRSSLAADLHLDVPGNLVTVATRGTGYFVESRRRAFPVLFVSRRMLDGLDPRYVIRTRLRASDSPSTDRDETTHATETGQGGWAALGAYGGAALGLGIGFWPALGVGLAANSVAAFAVTALTTTVVGGVLGAGYGARAATDVQRSMVVSMAVMGTCILAFDFVLVVNVLR